ncbi:MAG: VCBS repeat-containing protein [Gemmatimonadetes bacterium]|nr:VCBS repeat-containing protein [Gemmatimonadota bacterium]
MMSTWRVLGIFAPLAAYGGCSTSEGEQAVQISFDRIQVEVGVRTTAILTWDMNRDGRLDLVVSGGGRVVVLHGRGDGHFDVASSVDAGDDPVDLAAADLDGDGLADLAVANHDTDYVTLLFAVAGGSFERRSHSQFVVGVSPHPHAVRLHDIDGDGHADLLVDDRTPQSIRVFAGVGDGTFANARLIGVGGDPYRGMTLAHLNEDEFLDLVTPNPDHVSILFGDGSGDFIQSTTLRSGLAPFSVVAADVNGDGIADLAAGSSEGAGTLAVWHGRGDGSFGTAGEYQIAAGPTKSTAADLTGDGLAEVLVASYMGSEVAILTGGESPVLYRLEVEGYPYGFATGDFDGDGLVDFAIANDGVDQVTVFLSRN